MNKTKKEVQEELGLLSTMLESLIELLQKKGILKQAEWEKLLKTNIKI